MKLKLLNNSYIHPVSKKPYEDVFLIDTNLQDHSYFEELNLSFGICKKEKRNTIVVENDKATNSEVDIINILFETTLIFSERETPTMYDISGDGSNVVEFNSYLKNGGSVDNSNKIQIGWPSYREVQRYIFKDSIGNPLEINPKLKGLNKLMAEKFILENVIINGEPIGKQFYFDNDENNS